MQIAIAAVISWCMGHIWGMGYDWCVCNWCNDFSNRSVMSNAGLFDNGIESVDFVSGVCD